MLHSFKDYKIYIHILYHILEYVEQKKTKFAMEQPYMSCYISYTANTMHVDALAI